MAPSFGFALTCRCATGGTHRRARAVSHELSPEIGSRRRGKAWPLRRGRFQVGGGGPRGRQAVVQRGSAVGWDPRPSGRTALASAPMNGHLNPSQEWSPSDAAQASQERSPIERRGAPARPMNRHLAPISTHLQPHERSPFVPHPHTYRPRIGHLPAHEGSPIEMQRTDPNEFSGS